jgi:glutamine amidotransferase
MTMNKTVQLIDAGTGNLQSVHNALTNLGAQIVLVSQAIELKKGLRTILPGVGAFRQFMEGLQVRGFSEPLCQIAQSGVPLLGICVGMQAMFDTGEELGEFPGLGIIHGKVSRFPDQTSFKVPHTGWNDITAAKFSPLLTGIEDGSYFYFNHSYFCQPLDESDTLAKTDYIQPFSSAISRESIYGVQFHPEKSQKLGQMLLQNFLNL